MRPKRWIDPSEDTRVSDGDLRIVKLANGQIRASKWVWRDYHDTWGCYVGSDGEPIGDVVEVGVTWEPKPKRKSGPSGKALVPKRDIRIPDDLWQTFGQLCTSRGTDRSKVVNRLVAEYCEGK